ncbi:U-box domain-containing protein 28 [Acorus calamus]|uniref:U-box domain-containing protein n=1 Tax=Acorus calamus TaxID=4465 RepID=A0AAV9EC55_ACOCL|nr:U-box domain-containing protein 28 [Acorus calamus]
MQVLPSKDFIPNLTLHRLINLWSSSPSPSSSPRLPPLSDLLRDLQSSTTNTHHLLSSLSSFAASSDRNRASLSLSPCPSVLLSLLARHGNDDGDLSVLAGAARVLSLLNLTDPIPETPPIARALSRLLRAGSPDSRVDAARVLDSLARSSPDARLALASSDYGLLPLLLRMLDETHTPSAVDAALACLITLSAPRRARAQVVRLGVVPKLTRILSSELPAETVEGR